MSKPEAWTLATLLNTDLRGKKDEIKKS